jgi:hypothetical protein
LKKEQQVVEYIYGMMRLWTYGCSGRSAQVRLGCTQTCDHHANNDVSTSFLLMATLDEDLSNSVDCDMSSKQMENLDKLKELFYFTNF